MSDLSNNSQKLRIGHFSVKSDGSHYEVLEWIKHLMWLEKVLHMYGLNVDSLQEQYDRACNNRHVCAGTVKKLATELEEAKEMRSKKEAELYEAKAELSQMIEQVEGIKEKTVLRLKFVDRCTTSQICRKIYYQTNEMYKYYRKGLKQLEVIYIDTKSKKE